MPRVAVVLPTQFENAAEFLADAAALDAAGAYAVLTGGSDEAALVVLGAVAAVTHNVKVGCLEPAVLGGEALATLDRISRGRAFVIVEGDPAERWTRIDLPPDRAMWNEALAQAEAAGATGVVVRWDPRLVDLLRNPGEEDDRSDLLMSTG